MFRRRSTIVMASRLTRSVSPLLRRLLPNSSNSSSSSSAAHKNIRRPFATLTSPAESSLQRQSKRRKFLLTPTGKADVRQASGGGVGGQAGAGGKDDKPVDEGFTEKDWEKVSKLGIACCCCCCCCFLLLLL